ncbi:efflux RND transporter periplasmic adaptor subunit [Variovorax sp. HJSM1_2]|uniref:efflux RND transporter periplasmic adaptor subunit n=1 Tax=Variovorax sp. HJSM1_2 TaxID=3366263 RepID=UPI003BD0348F
MDHPVPVSPATASESHALAVPAAQAPMRRRRWVGWSLSLLLVLALAGLAWYLTHRPAAGPTGMGGPGRPGGPGGPGPGAGSFTVTVGSATVRQTALPVTLDALGTVTPVATVTLKAQVGGVLAEVLFEEGQMVQKGQLLARIDPRTYEQALMQAQGTRQRDEAQLEAARVTLARYNTLLGQDSIARQDVDSQAALVKQLEGTVLSDKASEATARVNLDYTRITAPVSGRIGLRSVDAGNTVTANATTGIAVITQMTPIDVQFAVPQDQVPDIQRQVLGSKTAGGKNAKGQMAVVAIDRNRRDTLDTGSFSTLDNLIDTTTGTVKAKARFANTQGNLFPNQFVNVRMTLRTVDALVVPVTAVRNGPTGSFVYVVQADRRVEVRQVKRGISTVNETEITEGLKAGEIVVTEGGDRLSEGSMVTLQGEKPRAMGPRNGASGPRSGRRPGAGAGAAPAEAAASAPAAAASAPAR